LRDRQRARAWVVEETSTIAADPKLVNYQAIGTGDFRLKRT
jgi:hypothetical protein